MKFIDTDPIMRIIFFLFILFLITPVSKVNSTELPIKFSVEKRDYDYFNKCTAKYSSDCNGAGEYEIKTITGKWKVYVIEAPFSNGTLYDVCFKLMSGSEKSVSLSIDFPINNWSLNNYVLLPGAAYNGNRFQSRKIAYSPKLLDPRDIGVDKPIIISDVPRLNVSDGPSQIMEKSGSMSFPSIGYWDSIDKKSVIILTTQANECGDLGINIEENRNRDNAVISLKSPVVREGYRLGSNASEDIPADFNEGDSVKFVFKIFTSKAESLQGLFDDYLSLRDDKMLPHEYNPLYPFSYCFNVIENKFNSQNFVPEWGYYSVGMRETNTQDWAIGWTGGMITTYPLLWGGDKKTVSNVIRNFDWLFDAGISPSGFFWDTGAKGNIWYGGDIRKPHTVNWHLIRRSSDALFFIMKQFDLFEKRKIPVRDKWKRGAACVADALVKNWHEYGQFGQFVNSLSGNIEVGGSTSGAIIPGALALASLYYNNSEYLNVALEAGEYYYKNYIKNGITCGGPADALQNPDSESSYSMLESFITLYEITGEDRWLKYSIDMAAQYSTWVFSYDFRFPEASTFGKLGVHSNGSVYANTQNKHSAPGICTHSGAALLRLYRITGDDRYLKLLKSTAFNIPQYMSTSDRKIDKLPDGWINERVNTTDWEGLNRVGEVFRGSTWAETSLLLTTIEVPGIYVDTENKIAISFDNLEVRFIKNKPNGCIVEVSNPTDYESEFTYIVDNSKKEILPLNYLFESKKMKLNSGEKKLFYLKYRN